MKKTFATLLALSMALSLEAGAESAYPIEIESDWGTAVIESEVNAIAVYDLGMLDILDTLGFGDYVVAVTSGLAMPDYLSDYAGDFYVDLGGFKDWDQDALAECNPDLILAGFRQTKSVDVVDAVAPAIYFAAGDVDSSEEYMAALEKRVNAITTLFGGEETAQEYLDQIQEMIDTVQSYTAENEVSFICVTCEDGGLSLGANNSNALLSGALGFISAYEEEDNEEEGRGGDGGREESADEGGIAEDAEADGEVRGGGDGQDDASIEDAEADGEIRGGGDGLDDVSIEEEETEDRTAQNAEVVQTITDAAPTYVFVFDKDAGENMAEAVSAQEVVESTELADTELYQNGNIIYMDEALWYSADGGLTSTIMQLEQIIDLLGLE
ncbi:MAG: ABC transporter substrate-binding protein [Lachnospiraceae bacterium]|nr:ABC transporter substrate-binding protein [Lachnospiraceae bacterium]